MSPTSWLAASLFSTAVAQVAFKAYFRQRQRAILAIALLMFLLVPWTTYKALHGLTLATVYVATAASQLLVVLLSLLLLGERYSRRQAIGFCLVLAGVILFNA